MLRITVVILCLSLSFNTQLAAQKTAQELSEYVTTSSTFIIQEVEKITALDKLNFFEISEYGKLKNYYDAYIDQQEKGLQTKCLIKVQAAKAAIDFRRRLLDNDLADIEAFKKEIHTARQKLSKQLESAKTLKDSDELEDLFFDLNLNFSVHTSDNSLFEPNWLEENRTAIKKLEKAFKAKQLELAHKIPKISNHCKSFFWDWEIEGYQAKRSKKEKKIQAQLLKIQTKLSQTDSSQHQKILQLKAKEEKLQKKQAKRNIEKKYTAELILRERLNTRIVLCEKIILHEGRELRYWGINEYTPPNQLLQTKAGELSIHHTSELQEHKFHDQLILEFTIGRFALGQDEELSGTKFAQIRCKLSIKDHPNKDSIEIKIEFSPKNHLLSSLNKTEGSIGLYYFENLEKRSLVLEKELKESLN